MIKLKYIGLVIALLSFFTASAQEKKGVVPQKKTVPHPQKKKINIWDPPVQKGIENLKVGDAVPDFKFRLFNDQQKEASVAQYGDRLLVFDFGNTGCSGCIAALPHMDRLQRQFGDKIKILWVTPESEADVAKFWNRAGNEYTKNNTVATVMEDSVARAYFKHRSWPHEAWVYKGKVVALTGPDYVDEANIKKILDGQQVNWPVKNDFYVFDQSQPLFATDPAQIDAAGTFIKYAAIADYKEGVNSTGLSGGSGIVKDPATKTIRTYFLNQSVYNSYLQNWMKAVKMGDLSKPEGILPGPNEVVWEVADRDIYTFNNKGYQQDWIRRNGICFESVNPDTGQTNAQVARTVIADLDRLLGLRVRWEKRNERVLVLVRTTKTNNLKSKKTIVADESGASANLKQKGSLHQFRDWALANLVYAMNQVAENPYVFNETGFKDDFRVDMDLNFSSWKDISGLRKALQAYGLDLKEESRLVDKFVFTEVSGGMLINGPMQAAAQEKRALQKEMRNPTEAQNKAFMEANKSKAGVTVLPSGLQYQVLKTGKGLKPRLEDTVRVHYTGMLVNGKIFDSSYEKGKASEFAVNGVIKGWTAALQLMPAGSKWILYVPAALAYQEHTGQGTYPPNSNMIFEIELIDVLAKK